MTTQPTSAGTAPGMIALDRHDLTAVPRSAMQPRWQDGDAPLPTFYIGHGFPGLLDDGLWMSELFEWAVSLPKPKGIVIVSAHWEQAPTMITAPAAGTPLVYDFGGFEERFYQLQYATPDATELGRRIAATMPDDEPLYQHRMRGLDHGAWVPLSLMYPAADVPVAQLSILRDGGPADHLALGEAVRPLRDSGVLVLASGSATHNLYEFRSFGYDSAPPGWVSEFGDWVAGAVSYGRTAELLDYRRLAPSAERNHPTEEHLLPLYVAMGAGGDSADFSELPVWSAAGDLAAGTVLTGGDLAPAGLRTLGDDDLHLRGGRREDFPHRDPVALVRQTLERPRDERDRKDPEGIERAGKRIDIREHQRREHQHRGDAVDEGHERFALVTVPW